MMREALYWQEVYIRVDGLTVYRNILRDETMKSFLDMCHVLAFDPEMKDVTSLYYDFLSKLLSKAEELGLKGHILRKYVIHLFLNAENDFTLACERGEPVEASTLYQLAAKDAVVLHYLCGVDIKNVCDNIGNMEDITAYVPVVSKEDPYLEEIESTARADDKLKALIWRCQRMGAGDMAHYRIYKLFGVSPKPVGIPFIDPVVFSDIVGLSSQKAEIIRNTEDFLAGRPAHNVLLGGTQGGGKSSCVRALVNTYADRGLRMVEMHEDQAAALSDLVLALTKRGKFYIIYMDDLTYNNFDTVYIHLRALLEGSAEAKPRNVLFYAASNRRHNLPLGWNAGEDANMAGDREDAVLADRFGLTVTFPNLSQTEYLEIVKVLAGRRGLMLDAQFMADQAVKWAGSQEVTGRMARQFVDHIANEMART